MVALSPNHFQGEREGGLGVGHGAGVRLWGRVGGGVSGCSESLAVLSFILPLYSTSMKLNLQPFKIAITIFIASNSKAIILRALVYF